MGYRKIITILFVLAAVATSCKQSQEARRPISQASGTFMKKSIERNKKLIAGEEGKIQAVIKRNSKTKFIASAKGYWYAYSIKNIKDTITPKKGDIAFFDYEIKDLKGNIIYNKKEKINFLFTSQMGYGYHGDDKKIGTNMPLLCIVTLRDFMSEAAYKKELELKTEITSQIKSQDTITQ